jgi:ribose transport system substrate-binding protein
MLRSFRWLRIHSAGRALIVATLLAVLAYGAPILTAGAAAPLSYAAPTPLAAGSQAACSKVAYKPGKAPRVAYMPPATEFNYYIAIGEGVKARAKDLGASTFMLAPQSGNDINGQMGMIQDVITQRVNGIILSTHDEHAAAPLVKRAVAQGIAVIIVNSDIANFPSPVNAVVGYKQRKGTFKIGQYAIKMRKGQPTAVGILEGAPGYHTKERVGGFVDAIKTAPNFKIVSSLNGNWNVDGGNKAALDMLQAHPDVELIFAANDYEIFGAAKAAKTLKKQGLILLGNDGDTGAGLEPIANGEVTATVNTTPFEMGRITMQVMSDCLNKKFRGGYVETPTVVVDRSNVVQFLCRPERLYPKPTKAYACR